mgnify:CR=1 FL=1
MNRSRETGIVDNFQTAVIQACEGGFLNKAGTNQQSVTIGCYPTVWNSWNLRLTDYLMYDRITLSLLTTIMLSGCVSHLMRVNPNNAQEVNEEVDVKFDPFKHTTYFQGPIITNTADDNSGAPEVEDVALRAITDQHQKTRYFLTVTDYYDGDWRGYDQAFDLDGAKFHALSVRHKVNCTLLCGFDETIEIELSRKYLDDRAHQGVTMRLYGPSNQTSAPFSIPAEYIQGFLKGSYSP